MTSEVKAYLEGLLNDSGLIFQDSEREQILNELFLRLENYLASVILENVPEEDQDKFISDSGNKDLSQMQEYLLQKIPNAKDILAKAFVDFRQLYLGNVAVKKEAETIKQES